jgi:hypothetical protein
MARSLITRLASMYLQTAGTEVTAAVDSGTGRQASFRTAGLLAHRTTLVVVGGESFYFCISPIGAQQPAEPPRPELQYDTMPEARSPPRNNDIQLEPKPEPRPEPAQPEPVAAPAASSSPQRPPLSPHQAQPKVRRLQFRSSLIFR